jgi:hypothetical protein
MGWNESNKSNLSGISYKYRGWINPHLVGYMESHDEERLMYKCITWGNGIPGYEIQDTTTAIWRMLLDAVFFLTVPGPKMIWQFGEIGYDFSIDYNGRLGEKPLKWDYLADYRRNYLYNFYSALIDLRKNHPVFETSDYDMAVTAAMKRIVLRQDDMNVVIIGNFGILEGTISGEFPHTGKWYDYFTGDRIDVASSSDMISLVAGEYHLYTDVKLETPDIGTGLNDYRFQNPQSPLIVFPNPAREYITIEGLDRYDTDKPYRVEILNLTGRKLIDLSFIPDSDTFMIDISGLNNGAFMILIRNKAQILARDMFLVNK